MPVVHIISRTHDFYLYKSVKASSCEGRAVCVKYESLEQTTYYWVGQNKYNRVRGMCKHGESCLNRGRGQDGHIREELQKTAAQVCIDVYIRFMMTLSLLQS
jgi:hypothetical protein